MTSSSRSTVVPTDLQGKMADVTERTTPSPETHRSIESDLRALGLGVAELNGDSSQHPFAVPQSTNDTEINSTRPSGHNRTRLQRKMSTFEERVSEMRASQQQRTSETEGTAASKKKWGAWFYPTLHWGLSAQEHTRQDGAHMLQVCAQPV